MGICDICKHKEVDITGIPCRYCMVSKGEFEIDFTEHDKQIKEETTEKVLSITNAVIEGVKREFARSNDMVNLGVMCELQRFRDMLKKTLKEQSNDN